MSKLDELLKLAEALRDALVSQYPHGVILPEPVTANAVGLAIYARRVWG